MKPELICEIIVHTQAGKSRRGSGYPITPNRILTAAHVVKDAKPIAGEPSGHQQYDIKEW